MKQTLRRIFRLKKPLPSPPPPLPPQPQQPKKVLRLKKTTENALKQSPPSTLRTEMEATTQTQAQPTGNDKRIESCKKVGGDKKRRGHALEKEFNTQFGGAEDQITYKAVADCTLCAENPNTKTLLTSLIKTLDLDTKDSSHLSISLKSGKNLQFVLGNIPEITKPTDVKEKLNVMKSPHIWNKYLKKSESEKPAGLLVYYNADTSSWIFFKMDTIINFIVTNCKWRSLETGRMKGDFGTEKGFVQFLTYEYRTTHKSHFLGANGNKGLPFIELLKKKIPFVEVEEK
jgi:hypothetical protein